MRNTMPFVRNSPIKLILIHYYIWYLVFKKIRIKWNYEVLKNIDFFILETYKTFKKTKNLDFFTNFKKISTLQNFWKFWFFYKIRKIYNYSRFLENLILKIEIFIFLQILENLVFFDTFSKFRFLFKFLKMFNYFNISNVFLHFQKIEESKNLEFFTNFEKVILLYKFLKT